MLCVRTEGSQRGDPRPRVKHPRDSYKTLQNPNEAKLYLSLQLGDLEREVFCCMFLMADLERFG